MNFRHPASIPGASPVQGQPVNGQQALYLLALMAQLAQAAQQGQPAGQAAWPQPGSASALWGEDGDEPEPTHEVLRSEPTQSVQYVNPVQWVQPVEPIQWPGSPQAQRAPQGQGPGTSPSAPPVPTVAPVEVPRLPVGVRERSYWFGGGLPTWPTNSLNRWTRGPMRSVWRR